MLNTELTPAFSKFHTRFMCVNDEEDIEFAQRFTTYDPFLMDVLFSTEDSIFDVKQYTKRTQNKVLAQRIKDFYCLLPKDQLETFLLKVDKNKSFSEIALILGISKTTANRRYSKAVFTLRTNYVKTYGTEGLEGTNVNKKPIVLITKEKLQKQWTAENKDKLKIANQKFKERVNKRCRVCNVLVSPFNVTGLCSEHHKLERKQKAEQLKKENPNRTKITRHKKYERLKKRLSKKCTTCGKQLSPGNKSGKCIKHVHLK